MKKQTFVLFSAVLLLLTLLLGGPLAAQCVGFDRLAAGTDWGAAAGNVSGDQVHVENGIRVSVLKFSWPSGGTFGNATVDPSWSTSPPNSVNTNNINLGFDFTGLPALPSRVAVDFRDLGGFENLAINGSTIRVGELVSGAGGGLSWTVSDSATPGGRGGRLTVYGAIHSLIVGGQEFWLDTLCASSHPADGLDHFKVYDVRDIAVEDKVELRGQFDDREPRRAILRSLTHFANPVSKNGEPIHHRNAHLTFYRILQEEGEPDRLVAIENQFGRERLKLGQPVLLAVPAEKIEDGSSFPKHLDHYKCYESAGEPVGRRVVLADQFGKERGYVSKPRLFCVPVLKRHGDETTKIRDRESHLVFYALEAEGLKRQIKVRDQFGRQGLEVIGVELLGVPSRKLFTTRGE